jgi:hypothetical protein
LKIKNNRLREAVVYVFLFFVFEHFFYSSATPIIVMPKGGVNSNFYYVQKLWKTRIWVSARKLVANSGLAPGFYV